MIDIAGRPVAVLTLDQVAEQLGHKDPAMTARVYAHVALDSQRVAVRLLNRRKA